MMLLLIITNLFFYFKLDLWENHEFESLSRVPILLLCNR